MQNNYGTRQCPYCHQMVGLNGLEKFITHMSDVPGNIYCAGTGLHYPTVQAMDDLWMDKVYGQMK